MPTKIEMQELYDNCTHTWTTQNDVNGCLFTGPNGNSIFLPAAGYRSSHDIDADTNGYYWSSSLNQYISNSIYLRFNSDYCYIYIIARCYGLSVRAVCR